MYKRIFLNTDSGDDNNDGSSTSSAVKTLTRVQELITPYIHTDWPDASELVSLLIILQGSATLIAGSITVPWNTTVDARVGCPLSGTLAFGISSQYGSSYRGNSIRILTATTGVTCEINAFSFCSLASSSPSSSYNINHCGFVYVFGYFTPASVNIAYSTGFWPGVPPTSVTLTAAVGIGTATPSSLNKDAYSTYISANSFR